MPITPVPSQYLSDTITRMQRQLDELGRAVGRPTAGMRDASDNTLALMDGHPYPVLRAEGQDTSLVLGNGSVTVMDDTGRNLRPVTAQTFYGPVTGDTTGVHHGDVGVSGSAYYNHYGDVHGNSYGFHYGPVGDGTTQYQVNALNVYATGVFSNIGVAGQNWTLYGTVVAPSERKMKTDIKPLDDAGRIVDAVQSTTWQWHPETNIGDRDRHAGPMVDDIAEVAPWLVRHHDGTTARSLTDRDLVGVLWEALRETRHRLAALEASLGGP